MTPVNWRHVHEGEMYLYYSTPTGDRFKTHIAIGVAKFSHRVMSITPYLHTVKERYAQYPVVVRSTIQDTTEPLRVCLDCMYASDMFLLTPDEVYAVMATLISEVV